MGGFFFCWFFFVARGDKIILEFEKGRVEDKSQKSNYCGNILRNSTCIIWRKLQVRRSERVKVVIYNNNFLKV